MCVNAGIHREPLWIPAGLLAGGKFDPFPLLGNWIPLCDGALPRGRSVLEVKTIEYETALPPQN